MQALQRRCEHGNCKGVESRSERPVELFSDRSLKSFQRYNFGYSDQVFRDQFLVIIGQMR